VSAGVSRRWALGLAAAAVASIAAVAVVAAVRGGADHSPPRSLTFHKGWIFHQRQVVRQVPYPGAGHYSTFIEERWAETTPPYRQRWRTRVLYHDRATTLEMGTGGGKLYAYDPTGQTVYSADGAVGGRGFVDPAEANHLAIRSHRWKVSRTAHIRGRKMLVLENTPVPGITRYIDASSFVLTREVAPSAPLMQPGGRKVKDPCAGFVDSDDAETTTDTVVYEYLSPTPAHRKLVEVTAQHPDVRHAPSSEMPTGFRKEVFSPSCGQASSS
jgi:hypothetical protein